MKAKWIGLAVVGVLVVLVAIWAIDINVTDEGELPSADVDVDVDAGELPEVDVDTADVEVGTREEEVLVPDVEVTVEEETITVPTIDIEGPDADEENNAQQ